MLTSLWPWHWPCDHVWPHQRHHTNTRKKRLVLYYIHCNHLDHCVGLLKLYSWKKDKPSFATCYPHVYIFQRKQLYRVEGASSQEMDFGICNKTSLKYSGELTVMGLFSHFCFYYYIYLWLRISLKGTFQYSVIQLQKSVLDVKISPGKSPQYMPESET